MTGRPSGCVFILSAFLLSFGRLLAGNATPVLLYAPGAEVSRLEASARAEDSQVRVRWQTTAELGVTAFRVLRQRSGGKPEPVGSGYVRAQMNEGGGAYELADPLAQASETLRYALLIVSPHDPDRQVAEWSGIIKTDAPQFQTRATSVIAPASLPQAPAALAQSWIGSDSRVRTWTNSVPADRVRLSLKDEGIYRASAQELAAAAGWDEAGVEAALATTNLSLTCQGTPVAWYADGTSLLFYGVPAASRFAPENVYWVAFGQGSNMARQVTAPEAPATTNAWFYNQITQQGTTYLSRVSYSSLADSPASYLSFNPGPLLGVNEELGLSGDVMQITQSLFDCSGGVWTGAITISLLSLFEYGNDGHEHDAHVSVGGTLLGASAKWSDEQYVSFTFPFSSTNLTADIAALKVENIAVAPPANGQTDYTRFLCMSYSFSYPRLYHARNGILRCTGGDGNTVAVAGFATNDVVVLDVTVTHAPVIVEPVTFTYATVASNWTAAFSCGGSGQVYQVCSTSAGVRQPAVRGVRDTVWSTSSTAADYVILIPPEGWCDGFRQAMQPLADYRNAQGLKTKIVDVESLYDAFSDGLADPQAIQAFCAALYPHGLKYLLLAGAGALDFKHQRFSINDYTACLIPTLIAGQGFSSGEGMTVALDSALGDVNNDGIPDVAVGRIPTTKTDDLAVVVLKTVAYESVLLRDDSSLTKRYAAVAADRDCASEPGKYYPFSHGTDRLIAPLQTAGRTVITNYPKTDSSGAMAIVKTNSLIPALKAGTGLFHFFGHSNKLSLGYDSQKLLQSSDVTTSNWQQPTLAVILGCQANVWHYLTSSVNIVPYGLFATNTGFVAGLGATGYMLGDEGEDLAVSLYTDAAEKGTLRLGELFRRGIQRMAGIMPRERLLCYSLVGDPALVVRHDISARGTPVAWLVENGLTAPNADLADPDLDGWPTWQEYGAGTSHTNCELMIRAARPDTGERWMIAFEANSNGLYCVEYTPSLLATDDWQVVSWAWTNATEWITPTIFISPQRPVTTVEVPASNTTTQGFYRIHGI